MTGRLGYWDYARGHGFITPDDGGPSVYVGLADFGAVPELGLRVAYALAADGTIAAMDVAAAEPATSGFPR